jgi:hypothetical protein
MPIVSARRFFSGGKQWPFHTVEFQAVRGRLAPGFASQLNLLVDLVLVVGRCWAARCGWVTRYRWVIWTSG